MSKDGLPKWAEVQKRTFTNWVNVRLSERDTKIDDLATDFSDGLKLIALLEIITEKKLPKHNREIKRLPQKTENVSIALQFLKDQGIKMVGIGADDIVDSRAKLILGLVWTIIQKYQIQKGKSGGGSAKDDLLAWVNKAIPDYNIKNFKADWRDGKALSALTDALKPGSIDKSQVTDDKLATATHASEVALKQLSIPILVSPEDLTSDDVDDLSVMTYISYFRDYDNARSASPDGSSSAGTPALSSVVSASSSVASPTHNIPSPSASGQDDNIAPAKCDVYGPGTEAADVGKRNICIIQAIDKNDDDIKTGGLSFDVKVTGPDGDLKVGPIKDNKDGTYTVVYTPTTPGTHTIGISYKSTPLGKSPFTVTAKGTAIAKPVEAKVEASVDVASPSLSGSSVDIDINTFAKEAQVDLSGLGSGPNADGKLSFTVGSKGSKLPEDFKFKVDVILLPEYIDVDSEFVDHHDGSGAVSFKPPQSGLYRIEVALYSPSQDKKVKVKGSPFKVNIDFDTSSTSTPAAPAQNSEKHESVGDLANSTTVDLSGLTAGPDTTGHVSFVIRAAGSKPLPNGWYYDPMIVYRPDDADVSWKMNDNKDGSYKVVFKPEQGGAYLIDLTLAEVDDKGVKKKAVAVKGSPFKLNIQISTTQHTEESSDHHKSYAEAVVTGIEQAAKEVETEAQKLEKQLTALAHETAVDLSGLGEGISEDGQIGFNIGEAGKHLVDGAHYDAKAVLADDGSEVPVSVVSQGNGVFKLHFTPSRTGKYSITLTLVHHGHSLPVKGSPFTFHITVPERNILEDAAEGFNVDPSGLSKLNEQGEVSFSVKHSKALPEDVKVETKITYGPSGSEFASRTAKHGAHDFQVFFAPRKPGEYNIEVNLVDKEGKTAAANGTPITLTLTINAMENAAKQAEVDLSSLAAEVGGEGGEVAFSVGKRGAKLPERSHYSAKILFAGQEVPSRVHDKGEGLFEVSFHPAESGEYVIHIYLVDEEEGGSVEVGHAHRVHIQVKSVIDPAVESAALNSLVDTSDLGEPSDSGELGLIVSAPGKKLPDGSYYTAKITSAANPGEEVAASILPDVAGSYKIVFKPSSSGEHIFDISLVDKKEHTIPISGSPFTINIDLETIKAGIAEKALLAVAAATTLELEDLGLDFNDDGEVSFVIKKAKDLPPRIQYLPKIVFAQEKSADIPTRFIEEEENGLRVVFKPPRAGEYHTQVWLADEDGVSVPVNAEPHKTNISLPPPPPAPVEPEPVAPAAAAPKPLSVEELSQGFTPVGVEELSEGGFAFLIGFKEKQLPDGYFVDVRVNAAADGADLEARVSDGGEGVTRVEFTPPTSGEYFVSAGLVDQEGNGCEILGSPFSLNVTKASPEKESKAFANDTFVDFNGFDRPRYDGTTSFVIGTRGKDIPVARFHYEPKIICVSTGKQIMGVKAIDQKNGTFKVSFLPPVSGDYFIEVDLIDKGDKRYTVKGSPFTVGVNLLKSPAPSPMFSQPSKNPTLGGFQKGGQPPSPKVGSGKVWARPQSTGGNVPKPVVPPWVQKTGRVWKQPSDSPSTAAAPAPVSGVPRYSYPAKTTAPAQVYAPAPSSPASSVKSGAAKKFSVVDVPATYAITNRELGIREGDHIDIVLEGPNGALPVDISYKGDGFDVSYTASEAGDHRIGFLVHGRLVYEDLISVDERADEEESIAVAFTFTLEARLKEGKPKTRGGDKFQVKITGPRGPVNTVQVIDQNNGRYNVNYTLPHGHGDYDLNVTLNGRPIAGSPWKQRL